MYPIATRHPHIGDTVQYILGQGDVDAINSKRVPLEKSQELHAIPTTQHLQIHTGRTVKVGDIVPCIVLEYDPKDYAGLCGKCVLFGSDDHLALSARYDPTGTPHTWRWPEDQDLQEAVKS